MRTIKLKPRGRRYFSSNFRDTYSGNVSVDTDGRVFLSGGEEVGSVLLESRFHFFEAEIETLDWERVRALYDLPKKMRHTCYSHGVRRGEGVQVGLGRYPKRPIHEILEERNCTSGEESYRIDYKKIEKMALEDLAAQSGGQKSPEISHHLFVEDDDELPF